MNLLQAIPQQFNSLQNKEDDGALKKFRQHAFDYYSKVGIPTMRHEEWKYTRLTGLLNKEYTYDVNASGSFNRTLLEKVKIAGTEEDNALFFINGNFDAGASDIKNSELIIMSIEEAASCSHADILKKFMGHSGNYMKDGMQALNTAFAGNGLFIYIKPNVTLSRPVYIYHLTDSTTENVFVQPRTFFYLSENSRADVVEIYANEGLQESFTNEIIEFVVQKDGVLNYHKVQNEKQNCHHVGTTHILHAGKCFTNSITVSLNGGTIRNNLNVVLDAEHNEAHLYGLYMPTGSTHIDNHTIVDNAQPNCYSNEFYKGIMNDKSTGVFNGKIYVRKDAQKTNAYQSNKNILLSDFSSVNTKPQLEIFADDVKCSHGCTIGRLDEEAMFYLRSRGLDEKKAQSLLLHAFASDIIEQVKIEPLKNHLEKIISERFEFESA